ncbi:MAG TPA: PAS domain-containing sensor histidine kinase, partial [Sphingomonas sp.]|nr:PAS domain-containing sensor histidine kinase [Sphingomonas sp.]
MTVAAVPIDEPAAPLRRFAVTPAIEFAVIAVMIAVAVASWRIVSATSASKALFSPTMAAAMLTANLIPAVMLIVLIGRRIAIRRAARASVAGKGRMHVRLVAVFSLMASIPIVLTVVAASVMFQSGVQLWGSERAVGAFNSTLDLAREGQKVVAERWTGEAVSMAKDIRGEYPEAPRTSQQFQYFVLDQTYKRNLRQSLVFRVGDGQNVEAIFGFDYPDPPTFAKRVSGDTLNRLNDDKPFINFDEKLIWVVT